MLVSSLFRVALCADEPPAATFKPDARRMITAGDLLLSESSPMIRTGHRWAVLPSMPTVADLLHLPPVDGSKRSISGSVRSVLTIQRPIAVATGWDGSLYLVAESGEEAASIMLLTARALIGNGAWDYTPAGRLETIGSLPAGVDLRSISGSRFGLVALWNKAVGQTQSLELHVLDDLGWRSLELPPCAVGDAKAIDAHLMADANSIMLAVRATDQQAFTVWRGEISRTIEPSKPNATDKVGSQPIITRKVAWGRAPSATLKLPPALVGTPIRTIGPRAADWLFACEGQFILAQRSERTITCWRLGSSAPSIMARVDNIKLYAGIIPADGLGLFSVLSYDTPPVKPSPSTGLLTSTGDRTLFEPGELRVIDISLSTGRVLNDAPAHTDGLLSKRDFQVLWLLFIAVGAVMLLFVMRAESPQEIVIPTGTALATPLRRSVAAMIDSGLAVLVASFLFKQAPGDFLFPRNVGSGLSSLLPIFATLIVAGLHCSIGEALSGRTLGKAVVGIGVISMQKATSGPQQGTWVAVRLSPMQALLRNAVRWWMPPLGMVMFFDNNWRHPGDQIARSVVVMPIEPETADDAEGDNPGE